MEWVEKANFKKIHRLLEVSQQECHYKVLLALKNLADVRRNPASYSLPIIQRPLPSEIVEGEHFVTPDLLRLISGGVSPSGGAETEIADRRSAARSPSEPSTSNSEGSGLAQLASRRGEGGSRPERLPLPTRGGKSAPQVLKVKKERATGRGNVLGTQVRDFIPWVRPESSQPSDLEEGEEEEMTLFLTVMPPGSGSSRKMLSGGPTLLLIRSTGQVGLQLVVVQKFRRLLFWARLRRDPMIS